MFQKRYILIQAYDNELDKQIAKAREQLIKENFTLDNVAYASQIAMSPESSHQIHYLIIYECHKKDSRKEDK